MNKLIQIGITGGIGSGKSIVCNVFQLLGTPVYDADSRAKSLMTTDGILMSAIKKEFGVLSYNPDGSLNREFLAKQVFNNQERLGKLNEMVHPRVGVDYRNWLTQQITSNYVIKEAALIFEAGTCKELDKVVVVHASEELRIQRVLHRDPQRSAQQVKGIMNNQLAAEEKLSRADYIIMNDEKQLVIPQIISLHRTFMNMAVDVDAISKGS